MNRALPWLLVLVACGLGLYAEVHGQNPPLPTMFTQDEMDWLTEVVRQKKARTQSLGQPPDVMTDYMLNRLERTQRGWLNEAALARATGGEIKASLPLQICSVTNGVVVMDQVNNSLMTYQLVQGALHYYGRYPIFPKSLESTSVGGGCLGEYMKWTNPPPAEGLLRPRRSKPISVDGVPVPKKTYWVQGAIKAVPSYSHLPDGSRIMVPWAITGRDKLGRLKVQYSLWGEVDLFMSEFTGVVPVNLPRLNMPEEPAIDNVEDLFKENSDNPLFKEEE